MAGGLKNSSGTERTDRTGALVDRANAVLAYGGRHQALLRPLYADEQGVFPELAEEASGYELTDTDGRVFVDWAGGWGPVLLGYRHPAVEEAIVRQLRAGPLLTLQHPIETEVAEALVDMVPCAEMVAFGKNGSDVTTAAVRIARAATGRDMILQCGFHGFHDWYTCIYRAQSVKGIPTVLRAYVQTFPYNDLEALDRLFQRYLGEIAAVVMEPMIIDEPLPGYLEGVRSLADKHGAVLVFDEVVTGFRLARGGAQERLGVTPDLACFGKGMANGMPLAAVAGKRELMRHLPDTAWGMTFRGETLSLAAAGATLGVVNREPVVAHLARIGEQVREAFHEACRRHGVRCNLRGPPARMTFMFEDEPGMPALALRRHFVLECARNGLLLRAGVMPSFAHDDEAIERTLPMFDAALAAVAREVDRFRGVTGAAVRAGFIDAPAAVNGSSAALPSGSLDLLREQGGRLLIAGWLLLEDGPPDYVELVAPGGEVVPVEWVERPDLADIYPSVPEAHQAGWSAALPAATFAPSADFELTIRALRAGAEVYACRIVWPRGRDPLHPGPTLEADGTLRL